MRHEPTSRRLPVVPDALTPSPVQAEIDIPIGARAPGRGDLMTNKPLIAALFFALPFASNFAKAAEVKILCASGMREIVSELQPRLGWAHRLIATTDYD